MLALRQASTEAVPEPPASLGASGDEELLQARIAGVRAKEGRQRLLADLLYLGTLYRLRSSGLELSKAPLFGEALAEEGPTRAAPTATSLGDSMRPLPAEAASEVRNFVLEAVPAEVGGGQVVQARREELGRLLMGGELFGYFLARAMQGRGAGDVSLEEAVDAVDAEWASDEAFVAASSRVGRLLGLPPESPDPLRRYESLREVSTEIRLASLAQADEYIAQVGPGQAAGLAALEAEDLRGLLGEACAVGFTLRLWESKLLGFTSPSDAVS